MNKKLVAAALALGFAGAAPAVAHAHPSFVAKTCSAGFVHGVIGGQQKCLRRGEFCAHRYNRQYHRYGYSCVKRDARGNYHLT